MVVESVSSPELRQTLLTTQLPPEDYVNSFVDPDADPVLAPYLFSVRPHPEHLRYTGMKLSSNADYPKDTR